MQIVPMKYSFSTVDLSQMAAEYRGNGFVVVENVLSSEELEGLRRAEGSPEVQDTLKNAGIEYNIVHLLELTLKHPLFLALAKHPSIMRLIEPLLGPDIQLQHSKLATKPLAKGKGAFGWHQDFVFYPHTNTDLLSVFVYLDDATPENGCMSMVRGSHRLGPLRHHDESGFFTAVCQENQYWTAPDAAVEAVTPRAGSVSIHHCLTLHGSPANQSGAPRRGLVFSYRAADAYQLADTIFADTGLQVAGNPAKRVRCEEMRLAMPKRPWDEKTPFGNAYHQCGEFAAQANGKLPT